jgi:hypothetical protein
MRSRALPFVFAAVLATWSTAALAQATWQPTAPPLVTAENTTWFQAGDAILWNGDYYYPAGAPQGFNQYQMVRAGSFRGIPLYTDATYEPYSVVFVPLAGARMQPYERRRTGDLAGTTGSRTPSLPTDIGIERTNASPVPQALAPPTFARAYDLASTDADASGVARAVPTSGDASPEPVGSAGRTTIVNKPARPVTTVIPPTGANTIWVNFDGRRWVAAQRSILYDPAHLNEIGSYQGWTVYADKGLGTPSTIYIPITPGRLAAYTLDRSNAPR